jgi:hypothetical protein
MYMSDLVHRRIRGRCSTKPIRALDCECQAIEPPTVVCVFASSVIGPSSLPCCPWYYAHVEHDLRGADDGATCRSVTLLTNDFKGLDFFEFRNPPELATQNNLFMLTRFLLIKSKRRRPAALLFSSEAFPIPTKTPVSHDEVLLPDLDTSPG